ncbi:MAG TPA: hypothetical protein VFU21_01975, partial [Kofleriaceae bacterium]|nr:hypothetical protein [Kofleriaceae bacterium]
MKVAVIGAGAAAFGVLAGLRRWGPPGAEVSLFDIGKQLGPTPARVESNGFDRAAVSDIYRRLRRESRLAFPPPKSHFGETLAKLEVEGRRRLWKSEHRGGLTNIWGGGMFPFTDRELASWPIGADDLDPYYQHIAENVGVCGERDRLSSYFRRDYVNRPPLETSPVIHKLIDTANSTPPPAGHDYDIVGGASRLALETRPGRPDRCTYLGECMLGCPRGAIWSAGVALEGYQRDGLVRSYVRGRVAAWGGRHLLIERDGTEERAGPFDRIFVAAGCIGSTEIVMRSLGIEEGPRLLDNTVMSFPILYSGPVPQGGGPGYFSLCNASLAGVPRDPAGSVAQVSIYPSFDHLWRYYTPAPMWSLLSGAWRFGRWRLLLGRVFLAGASNRSFSFRLRGGRLSIQPDPEPDVRAAAGSFMRSLRAAVNHNGFFLPPVPPGGHATSSHYASTFPYGSQVVPDRSGRVAPG